MKQLITIVSTALLVCSCVQTQNPNEVWKSDDAPLAERFAAAQALVTQGMLTSQAEEILGTPVERLRHNPGLPAGVPPEQHPRINWWYDYTFPDGNIRLHFLQVMDAPRFQAEFQSMQMTRKEANNELNPTNEPAAGGSI